MKYIKIFIVVGIGVFLCFQVPAFSESLRGGHGDGTLLFYDGFESGSVGPDWTAFALFPKTQRPEDSDSIEIVTNPVRSGKYALKVTVQPEDHVYPGDRRMKKERAELIRQNVRLRKSGLYKFGDEAREGKEFWYAWSVFIPKDYDYVSTEGNFQIMGQLHAQSAPGEEPDKNRPPISVIYRADQGMQKFRVSYGLFDRGYKKQYMEMLINNGEWIDVVLHVKFSQQKDGFLEAWVNGKMLTTKKGATMVNGPNMYNAQPNYLRVGLYRGFGLTQTNTLYYDEIKIGTAKEEVFKALSN